MVAAVDVTISALDLTEVDQAAVKLAGRYAAALDESGAIDRQASRVLEKAATSGDDELYEEVAALRAKLSARSALLSVGMRLESLLDALGATPSSRAKQTRAGRSETQPGASNSPLARLRSAGTA
jgi:hypothetical protein